MSSFRFLHTVLISQLHSWPIQLPANTFHSHPFIWRPCVCFSRILILQDCPPIALPTGEAKILFFWIHLIKLERPRGKYLFCDLQGIRAVLIIRRRPSRSVHAVHMAWWGERYKWRNREDRRVSETARNGLQLARVTTCLSSLYRLLRCLHLCSLRSKNQLASH